MKTMKSYLGTFAAVALLLASGAVSAAPIQGDVTFKGDWTARDADLAVVTDLRDAAYIEFLDPVSVGAAIGDFAGATDPTYTSFQFDPFVGPIAPLWTIKVGEITYSFNLQNITVGLQDANQLALKGTGTVFADGLNGTAFNWSFTGDSTGTILTFSAAAFNREVAVPEPSVVGLLGLGLIAMGAVGVRRRSAARKA